MSFSEEDFSHRSQEVVVHLVRKIHTTNYEGKTLSKGKTLSQTPAFVSTLQDCKYTHIVHVVYVSIGSSSH